jgi:hypothetical protein
VLTAPVPAPSSTTRSPGVGGISPARRRANLGKVGAMAPMLAWSVTTRRKNAAVPVPDPRWEIGDLDMWPFLDLLRTSTFSALPRRSSTYPTDQAGNRRLAATML